MSPDGVGPLSRPISVARVPSAGIHVHVEATTEERAALAADLGLASIERLEARLRLAGTPTRIRVTGRVSATVTQTCVVTLEDFDEAIDQEVDVAFRVDDRAGPVEGEVETDLDAPDDIVDGKIDVGAITVEFLALALDPYPKKPGAAFAFGGDEPARTPFEALAALTKKTD